MKRSKAARRIIGVDPGLASTGWGMVERTGSAVRYLAHGCITTKASIPQGERLFFIHQDFRRILEEWKPGLAAIETLYFGRNVSSAIPVAEARGVILMTLAQFGIAVEEFRPNAVKQGVVGQASADKKQVQLMVRIILGLKEEPRPQHAADALAMALCAARLPAEKAAPLP
ncbi:MAG: crossover junction endodeoxyribonuclease RuvC [Treponema sp.]|nr:crossover junction endodeoxyribonuclease RuvC [Treponema sp.]